MNQICTVCPGFSTQSEFQWELHEKTKEHQLGIDNFNRGVAWAEGQGMLQAFEVHEKNKLIIELQNALTEIYNKRHSQSFLIQDAIEIAGRALGNIK